ncbi:MAG: glycosyltransferase family 39 protein [Anaerolinea sp.]|nr:glycosyltransferase family 39 protein [Anaerolinea sp.]
MSRITATARVHALLFGLLALRLLVALPIVRYEGWFAHEADFYNVARTIAREGRLPTAEDFPDHPGVLLQADQPPLYNLVSVPFVALLDNADVVPPPAPPIPICYGWDETRPAPLPTSDVAAYTPGLQNPANARVALRLANLIMTSLAVIAVYGTARHLLPASRFGALFAAALIGFEPNTLFSTTIIGNDGLLLLIAAAYTLLIIRVIVRDETPAWEWGGVVLCTLLAALTRLNGWVLLPVTLTVILIVFRSRRWSRFSPQTRRRIWIGIGVLAVGIGVLLPVNLITTGSLFGRYRELEEVLLAGLPYIVQGNNGMTVFAAILRDTGVNSYLGAFAFLDRQRLIALIGWVSLLFFVTGLAAGIVGLGRGRRAALIALVSLMAFTLALVFVRHVAALPVTTPDSTTFIFAPLRYYLPALPALALVIGVGRVRLITLLGAGVIVLWIAAVILTPKYQTRTPDSPVITPDQLAALSLTPTRETGNGGDVPRVVGSAWETDAETNLLALQVVTALDQPTTDDYQARVEFVTPDGRSTFCQFPPARGDSPSSRWNTGDLIHLQAMLPNCEAALPAGTRLDLRWADANGELSAPILLGVLSRELPVSANCPAIVGTIGGSLIVQRFSAPLVQPAGALYLPSVYWYALDRTPARTRTYRLTHEANGVEYLCQGEPRQNTYPFAAWTPGTTIYFDECGLILPPDAPPGAYQVALAVFDADGNPLPAADANGAPLPDSWLPVATITLTEP